MPNILAVLDQSAFDALPDTTTIGKDSYTKNEEKGVFYANMSPDEAEKVAFNLQTKFENKKTEIDRLHTDKTELEKKVKAFERLGKTPDELKATLESNQPEEISKLKEAHQVELENRDNSYKDAIRSVNDERDNFRRELEKTLRQNRTRQIRLDFDLNDTADYVLERYIRFEPKEEGSAEYVERIYDENGSPALVAGQPMNVQQLLGNFREQKKFLSIFNGGTGGGTGATNRQGSLGAKQMKRSDWEQLPPAEQAEFLTAQKGILVD